MYFRNTRGFSKSRQLLDSTVYRPQKSFPSGGVLDVSMLRQSIWQKQLKGAGVYQLQQILPSTTAGRSGLTYSQSRGRERWPMTDCRDHFLPLTHHENSGHKADFFKVGLHSSQTHSGICSQGDSPPQQADCLAKSSCHEVHLVSPVYTRTEVLSSYEGLRVSLFFLSLSTVPL